MNHLLFTNENDKVRFINAISVEGDCHIWNSIKDKDGTGIFRMNGKTLYAHRVAYENLVGPINGLHVVKRCWNKLCVNKDHLFLVDNNGLRDFVSKKNGPLTFKRNIPCKKCGSFHFYAKTKQCATCKRRMVNELRMSGLARSSAALSLSIPYQVDTKADTLVSLIQGSTTSDSILPIGQN